MAGKEDDKNKETKWKPSEPLPDDEDEKEAKRVAAQRARANYLQNELEARAKEPEKKKSSIW